MKNAAVYIRVSTDDQTEHSPDSQLKEIKKYAKAHDMIISPKHIYTDAGVSGRKAAKRPEFMRMIAAAKESAFDVILVWKFSRFARNQEESILYKSLLDKQCNVDVISITEETSDSVFGSLIERIIEWMDEFYSIRLSEEVRTKMTEVASKGKVQTIACFGYRKKPKQPMEVVPEEAQWVKYIFEQFVGGATLFGIAQDLNRKGVKTHRGNGFENRTIEYMLHNPTYIGYIRWTPTGKTLSKRIYDSEDTLTVKSDEIEPIISEELFTRAQEMLKERKRLNKKNSKPIESQGHWLSGLIRCSNCNATLVYSPSTKGFQCHQYSKGRCHESHFISEKKLIDVIIKALEGIYVTDDFIRDKVRIISPPSSINYDALIKKAESMLDRSKQAYLGGIDTLEEYSANKTKLTAQIDELKAERDKNKVKTISTEELQKKIDNAVEIIKTSDDKKEKHDVLMSITDKMVFSRKSETVEIYMIA